MADLNPYAKYATDQNNPYAKYAAPAQPSRPQQPTTFGLPAAQAPQAGDAPTVEGFMKNLGDIIGYPMTGPPKPTGILPLDTAREYPYQVEAGMRSGLAMARHGANALSEGKPSGAVGLGVGGISALTAPLAAPFAPISRPVHDWIGNPVERATGIPADVVTAGALALPGAFKAPGALTRSGPRINEPAPPRMQIDRFVGGDRALAQRESVLSNLQDAKNAAYQRSEDAGVIIKPDALKSAADAIRADLTEEGFHPDDQPALGKFLDRLDADVAGGQNITLKHLDILRKRLVGMARDFNNPNQARLAGHAIEGIDSMPLADGDVIIPQGVDPLRAVQDLRQGRSLAKTQAKADTIDQYLRVAQNQAEKSKTQDFAGSVQNQLTNLLNRIDRKRVKGFTSEEIARLRQAANGKGITYKTLQWLGGFSPDNKISVLTEMLLGGAGGTVVGGPFGGAAGALLAGSGAGAKLASEKIMQSRANQLFNAVARGKAPKQIVPPDAMGPTESPTPPPNVPRLPAPSGLSGTMYSNPLDPAAIRALFFKGRPQPKPVSSFPAPVRAAAEQPLDLGPHEAQIAYHGTPHDFESFDSSKIGTGEGAQAYGHGLYFAENEKIAQSYRDALTSRGNRHRVIINEAGGPREIVRAKLGDSATSEQVAAQALGIVVEADAVASVTPDTIRRAKNLLYGWGRSAAMSKRTRRMKEAARYHEAANWLDANAPKLEVQSAPTGKVFQVAIKARPEEFLDWDKPLSEQPGPIRKALAHRPGSETGRDAYVRTGEKLGQPSSDSPLTAQWLKARGIKGIRYRDAGSRGADAKGSTYNYVVFDDKLISVLKKYAIPLTVTAGGAVLVSGNNLPPEIRRQLEAS